MKTLTIHILLVASLAPAVLSGRPIYHCQVTGTESFVSFCCPGSDAPAQKACCARCASREGTERTADPSHRVRRDRSSVCACCEVSIFQIVTVDPRKELPGADPSRAVDLESTCTAQFIDPVRAPACLFPHRGPPLAAGPPLPILYSVLRQ